MKTPQDNMKTWAATCRPPKEALKNITGGRLKGMTDIKPQWRYKVMTEMYGACGTGWKFRTTKKWTENGSFDQVFAFVDIELFVKNGDVWSEPIEGTGGSMLVVKEKAGLHSSDEAYKMATTDALSTAMKMLGVGADIYMGQYDGSKFVQVSSGEPVKKLTRADFKAKIDKLENYEAVEAWENAHLNKAETALSKDDFELFENYIKKVKDVFNPPS